MGFRSYERFPGGRQASGKGSVRGALSAVTARSCPCAFACVFVFAGGVRARGSIGH